MPISLKFIQALTPTNNIYLSIIIKTIIKTSKNVLLASLYFIYNYFLFLKFYIKTVLYMCAIMYNTTEIINLLICK